MAQTRARTKMAAFGIGLLTLSFGAVGCGEGGATGGAGGPGAPGPGPVEEASEPSALAQVALLWETRAGGNVLPASGALAAFVRNLGDRPVAGEVSVVSSGLDGRLVERPLGKFSVPAKQEQPVTVPILELPIQSEAADSFVALQASYTGDDGLPVSVPSMPLYYHFRGGFSEIVLRTAHEMATDPSGGVFTADPMVVEGRVLDAAGRMVSAADLPQPETDGDDQADGHRAVGLSGMRAFPAAEAMPPPLEASVKPAAIPEGTLAANTTVTVCSNWRVFYIDSARGEDVWPSTGWQDVPARYAYMLVYSTPGDVLYWQGNLDLDGCITLSLPAGSYVARQRTNNTRRANTTFNTYFMQGGVEYIGQVEPTFSVPSSGPVTRTLRPTGNNAAIQAAAVTGQVLATHNFNGGMGLLDTTYKIRTNQGCAQLTPMTDSCYNRDEDIVYIGTTVIAGISSAHWKFLIAHELGHNVANRAMGRPSVSLTDETATQPACRCDHYDPAQWGNRTHCLQSREQIGGAFYEGFGHAFAARAFNYTQFAEGKFIYYKPVRGSGGTVTNPPYDTSAFDPKRWMVNNCGGTQAAGRGVEWDWMTFFYSAASTSSANATNFANMFQIFNRACTGSPTTKCTGQTIGWSQLQTAAQAHWGSGSAAYTRFINAGSLHAVNF